MKKIYIGSDHQGFKQKEKVKSALQKLKIPFEDLGVYSEDPADFPLIAKPVCEKVLSRKTKGILICGTGIGMSIAANRFSGIRAALVYTPEFAELSRLHNDANVLVLSGKMDPSKVMPILKIWLNTKFSGKIRYKRRIQQIC